MMSDPYQEALNKLSESNLLCHEAYGKVAAKMVVQSAMELAEKENMQRKQDQNQMNKPQDLCKMNGPPVGPLPDVMSTIIDLGKFKKKNGKSKSLDAGLASPPDFDIDEENLTLDDEQEKFSTASGFASTGIGSKTDMSAASIKKEHRVSQRLSSKKLSSLDQAMKTMSYHMGRISFECECHFQNIPLNAMSKADRRHCRRFHKGLIGRKKVGEKRSATA